MRRVHFESTDSTNDQARLLAAEHAGEVLLVTAAQQTAGRGRQGRTWTSPPGGAWFSLAWPRGGRPRPAGPTPLIAALAVRQALVRLAPEIDEALRIKWPNDLLLHGQKLAGILCEQVIGPPPERNALLVIGIGINVDIDPADLGAELRHPATSLRPATGRSLPVESVINAVADELVQSLAEFEAEGFNDTAWNSLREHLAHVGARQTVQVGNSSTTGVVIGVDESGRLLLDCGSGISAFDTGELVAERR